MSNGPMMFSITGWLVEESGEPCESPAALAVINSNSYGYLGRGDRVLLCDAIRLCWDTFLTMENKLPKIASHIEKTIWI